MAEAKSDKEVQPGSAAEEGAAPSLIEEILQQT